MKKFLLFFGMVFLVGQVFGQTTIAFQGFEAGDNWGIDSGGGNVSSNIGASDFPSNSRIRTGSNSWQVNNGSATLILDDVSIAAFTNVKIIAYISSTSLSSGNGADGSDNIEFFVALNGGSFSATSDIDLSGNNNARWDYNATLTANTTAGVPADFSAPQGGTNSSNYAKVEIDIPAGTNSVSLKVEADNNSGNEIWNLDDFEITGSAATGNPMVGFTDATSTVTEGNGTNVTLHTVTVTMNSAPTTPVIVSINSADGTATTADNDYDAISNTLLTFDPADTYPSVKDVGVNVNGDDTVESDEEFTLNLVVTAGTADEGTTVHTVTIENDDAAPLPNIRINELDADTPGSDTEEFIELFGDANLSLDGVFLILFNGSNDSEYQTFDLTGFSTDANGYFIVGSIAGAEIDVAPGSSGWLQNGADAAALYFGSAPNSPTTTDLIDALVYDTNDSDDSGLLTGLGQTEQVNESINGNPDTESIQRGSWFVAPPTPRAANVALPISLKSFDVQNEANTSALTWTTSQELQNSHFEVQHSTDNRTFTTLEKIAGAGDSDVEIDYAYTHKTPAQGVNYYRLQQFDFDGQSSYSQVVSVRFGDNAGTASIYPNPVSEVLNVAFGEELTNDATAEIVNQSGSVVLRTVFAEKSLTQEVNTADLPAGVYFLRIVSGNEVMTQRFVKK